MASHRRRFVKGESSVRAQNRARIFREVLVAHGLGRRFATVSRHPRPLKERSIMAPVLEIAYGAERRPFCLHRFSRAPTATPSFPALAGRPMNRSWRTGRKLSAGNPHGLAIRIQGVSPAQSRLKGSVRPWLSCLQLVVSMPGSDLEFFGGIELELMTSLFPSNLKCTTLPSSLRTYADSPAFLIF